MLLNPRPFITLPVLFSALFLCQFGEAQAVTSSSVHPGDYLAEYALDGNRETRWASRGAGSQWLQVDLGKPVAIEGIAIRWEAAFAANYQVQVSEDAKRWQTIHTATNGKGGREQIGGLKGSGRYLRILCTKPASHSLYSIWEIELTGPAGQALAEARKKAAEARAAASAHLRGRLAEANVKEIVFAARHMGHDGHWYANFAYYARQTERKAYGAPGGRLYKFDVATGKATTILDDPQGAIRDPAVHYDGRRILFSWRKGTSDHYNLYEINADGTGLRQLTSGDWDDFEPVYLPDGGIMFVSSRCKRWVNCWLTQVAVLHRCDADGHNVRPISSNNEQDNTPWVLPDGRVLYQRWEYVDRSQVDYHHLWTTNPDGTNQTVYFGNMHPGIVMIGAKPIPGTEKVLSTFSPGHGQREHEGPFYIVDPSAGPDDRDSAARIGKVSGRDPWPLAEDFVLFSAGKSIRLIDAGGSDLELYRDPTFELHEPRPLIAREREAIIPSRVDLAKKNGKLLLADVHIGRNMEGVKPGEIKKLLILETLPKPINFTGGMDPLTYGGSFTLERIVGTVPVEPDGSAYFEVPALRSLFFVALDENDMSVKRMQSFLTVQPGETMSCVGCHEQRTQAPPSRDILAMRRKASPVEPVAGVPDVIDFPRDIQPILNQHCVSCHDYVASDEATKRRSDEGKDGPRSGGVILTADRGPMFSHSYYTLTLRRQFADGRNEPRGNRDPRSIGSSASPLMHKILTGHHGVKLSRPEIDLVRYWIETGATYPGTYAALGTGMVGGYYENNQVLTDNDWPASKAASAAIQSRCTSCHQGPMSLPNNLSDENDVSFWRPDWNDPRLPRARHAIFNLTRPDKSLALLAPLSKDAGGYGTCADKDGKPIFADTKDADYQKILAMCQAGTLKLNEIKRFDMPGFRPDPAYVREMQRYGVLTGETPAEKLNVYDVDQAYWRSLWYRAE